MSDPSFKPSSHAKVTSMTTRTTQAKTPANGPETIDAATGQPWGVPVSSPQTELTEHEREELEESSIVDRLRAIVSSSANSDKVRVKLYRRNKSTAKLDWCRDFTVHEFEAGDLESIRSEWGPGDYQIRVVDSKGIALRSDVTIAAPGHFGVAPRVEPANPQTSELAQILASMQQTQQQLLQALTERPDPQAAMLQTLTLAKAMREAFGDNTSREQPNQMANLKELLLLSREIKGAAKELAGDEPAQPENVDPLSMLPKVLDLVGAAMQQGKPAQVPAMLQPLQIPQSVGMPPIEQPQAIAETSVETMPRQETPQQLMLRGNIEELCDMAKANKTAEEGGEFIADNVPDDVIALMKNKYWFEIVAQLFPIIKEHETWIRAAKAEADRIIREELEAEDDSPPQGTGQPG
jgi:hypothetical protein